MSQDMMKTDFPNAALEDEVEGDYYKYAAIILAAIGILGFLLNLVFFILFFVDKQFRNTLDYLMFNLAFSNIMIAVLGIPMAVGSAARGGWAFSETTCEFYGFFMGFNGISTIATITCLAVERCRVMLSTHSSRCGCVGTAAYVLLPWAYAALLTVPPLCRVGLETYKIEHANISCSVDWHDQSQSMLVYVVCMFVFGVCVPATIICICYFCIFNIIKSSGRHRASRLEAAVRRVVLLMFVAFSASWAPYSVVSLMGQFTPWIQISPKWGGVAIIFAKSSIVWNSLIYIFLNPLYWGSIKSGTRFIFGNINRRQNPRATASPAHETTL